MAIQDITLVVKTKVDQLNKLEKSIDTVEKKIGKVSKKVIVLDTSKAVNNVEKLNNSLEKASRFVKRFSQEAKGFTGVRAISNELGMMNQQLAQARKAFNDTSAAMKAYKEATGKLDQADKNRIRTTQQQNAALSILAITYKKLRIENDAFVAAQARAFQKQGGGEDSITGGDTFGSIKKRVDAFKKWPETLDSSARALQEVNFLLNLAVKDSKAFNLLAKTKIELELKEKGILDAITGEKEQQTQEEKKQVTWIEKHIKELETLKRSYSDLGNIGSQLKSIFSTLGLGTKLGSTAALFGGGMVASDIGNLMGGIGLGGTGIAKSLKSVGQTTSILASVDAIGKLALGAQGLAVAADQGARAIFEMERTLAKFIPKAWEFATTQGRRGWDRHSAALGEHGGAGIRPADLASLFPPFMRMSAAMALPNEAKDDALFTQRNSLKVAQDRLKALSRIGLEADEYADTALYIREIERSITDEIKERELTLQRATDLTRGNLTPQQRERALFKAEGAAGRFKKGRPTGFAAWSAEVSAAEKTLKWEKKKSGELIKQSELISKNNKLREKAERQTKSLFTTEKKRNRALRARLKLAGKKMGMSTNTKDLESMMLGAGFPLLFGGGVGSVGGSIAGSGLAAMFGVSGFGPQIFGSAIGQMLETAVLKASELGKALSTLSMDGLKESGIRFTAELEKQVNLLKEAGEIEKAREVINAQVQMQIGASGGSLKDINGAVNLLKAGWDDLVGAAGAFLGIVSAPLLVALGAILKVVAMIFQGWNIALGWARELVVAVTDKLAPGLGENVKIMMDQFNPALQEAILKAQQLGREMRRNAAVLVEELSIRGQMPIGNTFEDQRTRAFGQHFIATNKFDTETETQRKALRKEHGLFFDEEAFNVKRAAEKDLLYQSLLDKLKKITQAEFKSSEALERNIEFLKDQNKITEKINAAKKIGDKDLVLRLQAEKEIGAIKQRSLEEQLNAKSPREKELAIEKEVVEIKKVQLKLDGQLIDKSKELSSEQQKLKAVYASIGTSIRDGLVEGINAAIDGTKTLGEVASNVFKRISNALMTYGIDMALMGLTGGTSGFFGQALGYGKRAAGGPVKGGSPYVVGEKGPELFVPGSSGNIVPNHEMGGSNIVVNVDASGSAVEGNEGQAAELGRMLGAAIQAELIKEKRPGGLLAGTR